MANLVVGNMDIHQLSDEELFKQLSAYGVTVGPIVGEYLNGGYFGNLQVSRLNWNYHLKQFSLQRYL